MHTLASELAEIDGVDLAKELGDLLPAGEGGTHSVRVGSAVHLFACGADIARSTFHLRWADASMLMYYVRLIAKLEFEAYKGVNFLVSYLDDESCN